MHTIARCAEVGIIFTLRVRVVRLGSRLIFQTTKILGFGPEDVFHGVLSLIFSADDEFYSERKHQSLGPVFLDKLLSRSLSR